VNSPSFSTLLRVLTSSTPQLILVRAAQINLKLKICKDSSVRKALVREASLLGAAKVVLGVAKKRRAIS
jgi:hypothetical protein